MPAAGSAAEGAAVCKDLAASAGHVIGFVKLQGKNLDAAHWVGAVKRDAEGSHLQLQDGLCRVFLSALRKENGKFGAFCMTMEKCGAGPVGKRRAAVPRHSALQCGHRRRLRADLG